jgi:asparagine synthase (glutamine-hydrolysing)
MCRLKITDQNDLLVPFYYPDLQIAIAFNGEIYNWRELRPCFDREWTSNCDAEVLAAAWRWKREECLPLFNGMWAFVLVDMAAGEVFAARDRAGLKPLFMAQQGETLYLASEIKALPIALEEQPCADMDCLEFDILRETPVRGVERIEPAHRLLLTGPADLEQPKPARWWSLPREAVFIGRLEAEEELERLILDSVYLRGNSEVRGAIQLSGGLDSAIIQAACVRLGLEMPLYCVSFPELDNLSAARLAAMGQNVHEVTFTREEFFDTVPSVAHHLDTPATWSAICLWHLAHRISQDGAKIVLSGEGADELLGGYSRYRILHWIDRMRHDPRLADYDPTIHHLLGSNTDLLTRLLNRGPTTAPDLLARLLDCRPPTQAMLRAADLVQTFDPGASRTLPRRMATIEFHTTMQVLLRMGDRMAAAWSLENRCPFLDYRIMEFCASLPDSLLVDDSESKSILRNVGRRLKVHPSITEEKTKKGLAVPWAAWNPSTTLGSRGAWDRSAFSAIMNDAWRQSLQRHVSCENL